MPDSRSVAAFGTDQSSGRATRKWVYNFGTRGKPDHSIRTTKLRCRFSGIARNGPGEEQARF